MSKRHEESAHIQTLQRELAEAKITTYSGLKHVIYYFPEIVSLLVAISDMIERADPASGAITDGDGRGSGKTLSTDGRSTSAGRSTLNDRKRLDRWGKYIDTMTYSIRNELSPHYKSRPGAAKPRCGSPKCSNPGKRQPHGTKVCMFCGRQFAKSGRRQKKTKTRLTLVKQNKT